MSNISAISPPDPNRRRGQNNAIAIDMGQLMLVFAGAHNETPPLNLEDDTKSRPAGMSRAPTAGEIVGIGAHAATHIRDSCRPGGVTSQASIQGLG
jgi:hypothetical protein